MGHPDCRTNRPYCVPVVVAVVVINVLALLGAARSRGISWNLPAPAAKTEAAKSSSYDLEFNPSTCNTQVTSPVCLLMTIGDDTGAADPLALPFSRLYRLFDAAKQEILRVHSEYSRASWISNLTSDSYQNSTGTNGERMASNVTRAHQPVKVIVGVDYASVACKMARDALQQDFRDEFPDVEVDLSCGEIPARPFRHERDFSVRSNFILPNLKADCERVDCETVVVGSSAQYVPQINIPFCEVFSWKRFRVVDLDRVDRSRLPPALPRSKWRPTIVTAFSSNHMPVALLMLRSLAKAALAGAQNISVVVYALEKFNHRQRKILECTLHEMDEKYGIQTEIREFDFSKHPSWMRINQTNGKEKGGTGEYAWKAIIVHTVLVERGFVLWADAGSRFDAKGLMASLENTRRNGFASTYSGGNVPYLLHPGQAKYLRYQVRNDLPKVKNCDASRIGITLAKYDSLARPWYDCSLTRQCIAPDGSDYGNHRQDQAALTLLADRSGSKCKGFPRSVRRHMDDRPNDFSHTDPTSCYNDPLEVEISA